MSPPAEPALEPLRAAREAYASLGDHVGVHLCELALVQAARDLGPEAVLQAVAAPLERMTITGSIVGADAIAVELILAAQALGAPELEREVRGLLVSARRPELISVVLGGLLDEAVVRLDRADEEARRIALSALELAAATDDFRGGADCLRVLAEVHGRRGQPDPQILCLDQAATYLERAGEPSEAAELRLTVADRLGGGEGGEGDPRLPTMLANAAASFRAAGRAERAVDCLLRVASEQRRRGQTGGALETLERAERLAPEVDDPPLEVRVYQEMAEAWAAAGDEEMASSYRARAELLAP